MKIAIYEPLCKGVEHLKFISLTVKNLQKVFVDYEFYLFAEEELCNNLKKEIFFTKVINISCFAESGNRICNFVNGNKTELDNIKILKLFNFDKIICTSASYYTIKNIKKINQKTNIYIFYHGIMESLGTKYNPYNMLYWFRKELKHIGKNVKNIVLGECIKENIIKELPNLKSNIFFVDLIYPDTTNIPRKMNKIIEFSGVGFGKKGKGSDMIFELSDKFSDVAHFKHIGMMDKELIPFNTKVDVLGKDKPVEPDEFEAAIKNCDYGLLFYDNSKYKFTASGAIFDILTQHKPVICLKNTYFNYVFDKMGDIGYICNDKEELFSVISKVIENHNDTEYIQKQQNIINNIRKFSEDEYRKQLVSIFK